MVNTEIRLIIFFAANDGETLYSQQKIRPGADCGSDHKILTAEFRETEESRENHWTIQVWPKSNPLQLYSGSDKWIQGIRSEDRVPEELWTEVHDIVDEAVIKAIPKKRKCKEQNRCLRRPYK